MKIEHRWKAISLGSLSTGYFPSTTAAILAIPTCMKLVFLFRSAHSISIQGHTPSRFGRGTSTVVGSRDGSSRHMETANDASSYSMHCIRSFATAFWMKVFFSLSSDASAVSSSTVVISAQRRIEKCGNGK